MLRLYKNSYPKSSTG